MTRTPRRFSRRFPDYGWAWPTGSLDQLLKAALLPDDKAALALAEDWLDRYDIDSATFRDHRLLAAISHRFGTALARHAAYPRLLGLRRHLWTRSRMAISQAEPVLKAISEAGIRLLLIKGASRLASDPSTETGRVAHDIDIVVEEARLAEAFALIEARGWQSSSGASLRYWATQIGSIQSMNFFSGSLGDIDLHRDAYPAIRDDADEQRLWRQAEAASFHGIPVLVPSAADRAALAIAHGSLAAHSHSDWIVDCGSIMASDVFSWPAFCDIVERRRLATAATIVLSYLSQEIALDLPPDPLRKLAELADRSGGMSRLGCLLQAKPRNDMSGPLDFARWLAKKARMRGERQSRGVSDAQPILRGKPARRRPAAIPSSATGFAAVHSLDLGRDATTATRLSLSLLIEIAVPPLARRIELEINSASRHLARLRYRKLGKSGGSLILRYEGDVRLDPSERIVTIEGRPIRQLRETEGGASQARFGALPFRLLSAETRSAR